MHTFGFNINMKHTPDEIRELGEKALKTGLYGAIEATYYENMQDVDTFAYNAALREIVKNYRPRVTVHISAFNASEESATIRSAILHEVENCCKYVKELGGHEIVMHSGIKTYGLHVPSTDLDGFKTASERKFARQWELTVKMFKLVCAISKEYGVTVYTENLNRDHVTVDMASLNRLLDCVQCDNLKIVFDVGHCNFTVGNIREQVLEGGKRVKHLHLHDNDGVSDLHQPLGEGNIDYRAFCGALKEIEYDGLYMMELKHCTPENLIQSRAIMLEYL